MAAFNCKICGGALTVEENQTVCECEYCGTTQTLPKLSSEKRISMYGRANHYRSNNDYDKAMGLYEQILDEDASDAEAYWSIVLCRYGIEYVEDPVTHKRMPTINRMQYTSIYDDNDYKAALEHSDTLQRSIYEAEAKTINDIQKDILGIVQKEDPFDVFICYKETDSDGRRTQDSVLANDLYHQLTQEGFKVFFSRITLEDKLGSAYEPYIFAALNSAKIMVVLGTKPEYYNAVWVKNEWSRYLSLVKQSKGKKMLIPAYRDMDPYDLPDEFAHLQAQDMSKLGFMQDLIRGIKKIIGSDQPSNNPSQQTNTIVQMVAPAGSNASGGVNPNAMVVRGNLALEDKEFDKADGFFEEALNNDPTCAEAYLGKYLAQNNYTSLEEMYSGFYNNYFGQIKDYLIYDGQGVYKKSEYFTRILKEYTVNGYLNKEDIEARFQCYDNPDLKYYGTALEEFLEAAKSEVSTNSNLKRAKQYATGDFANRFESVYDEFVSKTNNEIERAKEQERNFIEAAEADIRVESENAAAIREEDYENAMKAFDNVSTREEVDALIEIFSRMSDYKGSSKFISRCKGLYEKIYSLEESEKIYQAALESVKENDKVAAYDKLKLISGYKDADTLAQKYKPGFTDKLFENICIWGFILELCIYVVTGLIAFFTSFGYHSKAYLFTNALIGILIFNAVIAIWGFIRKQSSYPCLYIFLSIAEILLAKVLGWIFGGIINIFR